jgi:hypothetical protein
MKKFYQTLIIVLVAQVACFVYGMEDVAEEKSKDDAAMIHQLHQIGTFVYRNPYTSVSIIGRVPTWRHQPPAAYFLIRRDAVQWLPGQEHLARKELIWRWVSTFSIGAFIAAVGTLKYCLKKAKKSNSHYEGLASAVLTCMLGLGSLVATTKSESLADQCIKEQQFYHMPCLDIDPHKVIKKEFLYLYPKGSKLQYAVETTWTQHVGEVIAGLAGFGLTLWGLPRLYSILWRNRSRG